MGEPAERLSRPLAEFVVSATYDDLSPAAAHATKRSLIDGLAVMLAASGLGEGVGAFADLAQSVGGPGECSLIGRTGKVPLLMAALANGALAHAVDFEDSFDRAPVHPNAVQIPALLALCEQRGNVSGRELLTAMAVGCDLVCRLGLALEVSPDKFGWYPPPILGGFGAVASCAKLIGLDAVQIVDAFSLLLCSHTCSAELKYSPDSHVRAIRDGFPAQAALQAVLLAQRGVKGFDAPIEGQAGLFNLYARGAYRPDAITDRLGRHFHGEELSFKPWPSCRGTHAFIEAALVLRQAHSIDPGAIRRIVLTGHPILKMLMEPVEQKQRPSTAVDAKFSLPFTVALAIGDGSPDLASFSPEKRADERLLAIGRKVEFEPTDAAGVAGITSGKLALELGDGQKFEHHVLHPRGHPANPLDDESITDKFHMCARHAEAAMPQAKAEQLLSALWNIDQAAEVSAALTGKGSMEDSA